MQDSPISRKTGIAAIALLLAAFLVVGFAPTDSRARERTGRRVHMLGLTNQDRQKHDRRELDFAAALSRYAKDHSQAMARKGYIFHSTDQQLLNALGDVRWSIGGENVGVGGTLESLQRAFMASKLHRQNILRKTFDHGPRHREDRRRDVGDGHLLRVEPMRRPPPEAAQEEGPGLVARGLRRSRLDRVSRRSAPGAGSRPTRARCRAA
jgi:hypothetical protein